MGVAVQVCVCVCVCVCVVHPSHAGTPEGGRGVGKAFDPRPAGFPWGGVARTGVCVREKDIYNIYTGIPYIYTQRERERMEGERDCVCVRARATAHAIAALAGEDGGCHSPSRQVV